MSNEFKHPDFTGWATKTNLLCTDGVTIRQGAFKHNDQKRVPLVWDHDRKSSDNILGYAILSYNDDGVRTRCFFNDTDRAQNAKIAVQHGDLNSLSIYANKLVKRGNDVLDGDIGEVSLVISGANSGAVIDYVSMNHSSFNEFDDGEAIIYTNVAIELEHSADSGTTEEEEMPEATDKGDITLEEAYANLSDEAKTLIDYFVNEALLAAGVEVDVDDEEVEVDETEKPEAKPDDKAAEKDEAGADKEPEDPSKKDEEEEVKHHQESAVIHNVFEGTQTPKEENHMSLTHSQVQTIVTDARDRGSRLSASVLSHADEYGITNIDVLFPEARSAEIYPELVKRRTEWVAEVLNGVKKSPFAAIKSLSADVTLETARAKGYIKGSMKKDEFFSLATRRTTPTTIYKKQKLDRDDILDITDFDVVIWIKAEMRIMLEEEIARAILIGDGRVTSDTDKIKDPMSIADGVGVRSIMNDHDFYAYHYVIPSSATDDEIPDHLVLAMLEYEGKGSPTFYVGRRALADLTLLKDGDNRRLFPTRDNLRDAIGVGKIVDVDVFSAVPKLVGIITNLDDYTMGANKGGEINFFDDFDLDFNQEKYLLETRISGALTKHHTAIVVIRETAPVVPGP